MKPFAQQPTSTHFAPPPHRSGSANAAALERGHWRQRQPAIGGAAAGTAPAAAATGPRAAAPEPGAQPLATRAAAASAAGARAAAPAPPPFRGGGAAAAAPGRDPAGRDPAPARASGAARARVAPGAADARAAGAAAAARRRRRRPGGGWRSGRRRRGGAEPGALAAAPGWRACGHGGLSGVADATVSLAAACKLPRRFGQLLPIAAAWQLVVWQACMVAAHVTRLARLHKRLRGLAAMPRVSRMHLRHPLHVPSHRSHRIPSPQSPASLGVGTAPAAKGGKGVKPGLSILASLPGARRGVGPRGGPRAPPSVS